MAVDEADGRGDGTPVESAGADEPKRVLVALSRDLEVAHRAYLKSLTAAGFEVETFLTADDLIAAASRQTALIVVGAATGLSGMAGLELVRRLGESRPLPSAPVLLLHGVTSRIDSPLKVLRKWSEARQELGLDAPRARPAPQGQAARQPLVKLKSIDPTLELATRRAPGSEPDETVEEDLPSPLGAPPPPPPEILLTDADRLEEPDRTEEVAGPPAFPVDEPAAQAPAAPGEVRQAPGFVARRPVPAAGPSPAVAPQLATARPATPALGDDDEAPGKRRRAGPAVLLVVVALAVVAGGAGLAFHLLGRRAPEAVTGAPGSSGPTVPGPLAAPDAGGSLPIADAAAPEASPSPGADAGARRLGGEDGEPAAAEAPDAEPGGSAAPAPAVELGDELPDELVLPLEFARNSDEARVTDRRTISRLARMLIEQSRLRVELHGHISSDEPERLGMARARAARDVISARGPSRRRFQIRSAGSSQPVVGADGQESADASRRVVLRVTGR